MKTYAIALDYKTPNGSHITAVDFIRAESARWARFNALRWYYLERRFGFPVKRNEVKIRVKRVA